MWTEHQSVQKAWRQLAAAEAAAEDVQLEVYQARQVDSSRVPVCGKPSACPSVQRSMNLRVADLKHTTLL